MGTDSRRSWLGGDLREFTTVTKKLRRVARFDPDIVRRAIQVNRPNRIVLNHLDYVDARVRQAPLTINARQFVEIVEAKIGQQINWLGTGPAGILDRQDAVIRN
jgi:adenylosuccinate synthase